MRWRSRSSVPCAGLQLCGRPALCAALRHRESVEKADQLAEHRFCAAVVALRIKDALKQAICLFDVLVPGVKVDERSSEQRHADVTAAVLASKALHHNLRAVVGARYQNALLRCCE